MRILVIFTGGTIGCSVGSKFIDIDISSHFKLLDMYQKKYRQNIDFSVREPFDILSENMTYDYIFRIAEEIRTADNEYYDGIIVTHGTDSLQYTASCLGYLFCKRKTPIVLVSSDKPLDSPAANGLENFAAAVEFIGASVNGGVYVSYKNNGDNCRIHAGTRVLPHSPYSDSIISLNNCYVAELKDGNICMNGSYTVREDEFVMPEITTSGKRAKVLYLNAYVGMGDFLCGIGEDKADCILLSTYHSGTLPVGDESFRKFCNRMRKQEIPIYVCGEYMTNGYASGALFGSLGLISLPPISPVAMQTKYVLLNYCGRTEDMTKRLANDFDDLQVR